MHDDDTPIDFKSFRTTILTRQEIAAFFGISTLSVSTELGDIFGSHLFLTKEALWEIVRAGAKKHGENDEYLPRRKSPSATQRERIRARDGLRCRYCAKTLSLRTSQIDHILPVAMGGLNVDQNLVVCCRPCNYQKRDRSVEKSRMTLRPCPNGDTELDAIQQDFAIGYNPLGQLGKVGQKSYNRH